MGEAIVSKGLAGVLRHRQDDDNRSSAYDQLLVAEDRYETDQQSLSVTSVLLVKCCSPLPWRVLMADPRAQKGKKGIFSGKEVPAAVRLTDASEVRAPAGSQHWRRAYLRLKAV